MSFQSDKEFQRTIFGSLECVSPQTPVRELVETVADKLEAGETKHLVIASWLRSERTQAFIVSVPGITAHNDAFEEYLAHLLEQPCMESYCRSARPSGHGMPEPKPTPDWYELYLKSTHWMRTRDAVLNRVGSCVACNRQADLHVHHRQYETLGGERILLDLTVLCGSCHRLVHLNNPNLSPPQVMPSHLRAIVEDRA